MLVSDQPDQLGRVTMSHARLILENWIIIFNWNSSYQDCGSKVVASSHSSVQHYKEEMKVMVMGSKSFYHLSTGHLSSGALGNWTSETFRKSRHQGSHQSLHESVKRQAVSNLLWQIIWNSSYQVCVGNKRSPAHTLVYQHCHNH